MASNQALQEPIGMRLRRIRKARGYSQEQLRDISGVDLATLSRVETGKALGENTTLGTWMKLSWALGVSIDMLAGVKEF